jgi:predicted phage terminase large subunit-like protein
LDVLRERLEYPDLRRRVINEARRCVADTVLIEDAVSGTPLVQDLRMEASRQRNFPCPIGIRPRGDKVTRMAAQTAKIEAGQVLIPDSAPWLHDFQLEVLAFPNGRHDDQVDSMAQFLRWIAKRQFRNEPRERPDPVRPAGGPRPQGRSRSRRRGISGLYYRSGYLP